MDVTLWFLAFVISPVGIRLELKVGVDRWKTNSKDLGVLWTEATTI
jgi:hypothetical protein